MQRNIHVRINPICNTLWKENYYIAFTQGNLISAAPIFSKIGKIIAKDLKGQLTFSVRIAIGENAKFMN